MIYFATKQGNVLSHVMSGYVLRENIGYCSPAAPPPIAFNLFKAGFTLLLIGCRFSHIAGELVTISAVALVRITQEPCEFSLKFGPTLVLKH